MKKIFLIISLLFAVTNLMAEPIGEKRAREIATEFLSQKMTRATISNLQLEWAGNDIVNITRAGSDLDNSLMYIYNSAESKSFVIVGGDTNADFVLAYSLNNTFDMENMADGAKDILSAWCRQIEDARKNNKPINIARQSTRTNDALLYETVKWSQSEPYNREAPIINGERSLTGCAATAMAIICHYNKWPNNGVGTTPEYTYIDEFEELTHIIPANELGHTYEYDKMIACYDYENRNYTEEQANAVAALMKDMGTSIKMKYHPKSSGAISPNVVYAFGKYFGYSKNTLLAHGEHYTHDEWANILRENLRNYGPTFFCGQEPNGGHAFVLDGYDEGLRFSFNFGWNGWNNGYYYLPHVEYYDDQEAILYLKPETENTSQYRDNIGLHVVYIENELFRAGIQWDMDYTTNELTCWLGGFANYGATTFNGTIKLVLCDKNGDWKEELLSKDYTIEPGSITYYQYAQICYISTSLSKGDRLRVYYKGESSDEWQWARSSDRELVVDEALLVASPEDLAEGLSLGYDKTSGTLYFKNKHNMKIVIYRLDNSTYTCCGEGYYLSKNEDTIEIPSGITYKLEISLGSDPYELILKL